MAALRTYDGRRLERLIGISDAITAVAITLLAVPLISLGLPEQGAEISRGRCWLEAVRPTSSSS